MQRLPSPPHDALIGGDARCHSIAAAIIIAKTVRDAPIRSLAVRHPGYAWDTNAGDATPEHQAGLSLHGATRHHRVSFAPVAQLALFGPDDHELLRTPKS